MGGGRSISVEGTNLMWYRRFDIIKHELKDQAKGLAGVAIRQ
jgi:hypothetical protein